MFYQFTDGGMTQIQPEQLNSQVLTVGYVGVEDLAKISAQLGFSDSTVESCRVAKRYFRSGVEVYDDYTFTELRIFNHHEDEEDCVALYLKQNLLLVVDVQDSDGSTKSQFLSALRRYPTGVTLEKMLFAFLDTLVVGDIKRLEDISTELNTKEEMLLNEQTDKEYNAALFRLKKRLTRQRNYYEQILDITDAVCENDNDIFDSDNLMYISNITRKVERLREDADGLRSTVEHLQDAYSSYLDTNMNKTMKIFTVLTSVFFPLTIIVGWYGMNFEHMPEFGWQYGYVYVIALSVITVLILTFVGKKKKWF